MKKYLVLFLFLSGVTSYGQVFRFTAKFSVVLDSAYGKGLLFQCSRDIPRNVAGYWLPLQSDIDNLENNFRKVYQLTANKCCAIGAKVDSLDNYGFQYVGIKIKGEKLIYINAFPIQLVNEYKESAKDLKTSPVVVCDGGTSLWGVLYDVNRKTFTFLAFNGS